MTKTDSIKKNYILNMIYQVLTLLTPLVTAPYVSRIFGASGVGVYSYTSSVMGFFTMFAALGTLTYGQREIAQARDNRVKASCLFWEIELLSIITTGICLILWLILVFVSDTNQIYFAVLTLELSAVAFDISWFYAGLEKFAFIVARNTFVKFAGIAALFLLVKNKDDLVVYIGMIALSKLFGNISMWYKICFLVDLPNFRNLKIKHHFQETLVYFIPTIASSAYTYLDKTMIGVITQDTAENGYYAQCNKIIQLAYTIIVSLNTVMASRLSYLFAQNNIQEIKNKLEMSLAYILTVAIPITFGISGIANNFVPWFFGNDFEKVKNLLILCSPLVIIQSVHNFLAAQYLVPSGQRARSTKAVIAGALINFISNAVLIPVFQSIGAVIATLIGETAICIIYFYMSKEMVSYRWFIYYIPKQLISALVMYAFIYFVGTWSINNILITIIQVSTGMCIYFICLIVLREKFVIKILKEIIISLNYS